MTERIFYLVDVFAESLYTGNQLAVFRNGRSYSDIQMLALAKEMNFSETTFILSDEPRDGGFDVRIFTPAEEIPFAGHPTLGTAFVVLQKVLPKPVENIQLNLKVGKIPVRVQYRDEKPEYLWMQPPPPHFGNELSVSETALSLGIDPEDFDDRFPVQEVSTGLPFLIAALKNLAAVKKAKVDLPAFYRLVRDCSAKAILIFCPETYRSENDLNVRVFADYYNVPEDPATGSANSCLAGWLVEHEYFGPDPVEARVEQGFEIGRPSLLLLRSAKQKAGISIEVGGKVYMVAEGTLQD